MSNQFEPGQISVLLVTYNHEKYILRAIESVFKQDFNCSINLIIADDNSNDNTLKIIKSFEGIDNRFSFKFLQSTTRLGITKNYQRGFASCHSKYVAVIEGDDYWISPLKLRRQFDFLETHWECDLCSVNYYVYQEDKAQFIIRTPVNNSRYRLISARELIADNLVGNFSTCMYRKTALDRLPPSLFEITSYEWIVNICVATKSLIGFLEEPMSVYRLHSNGVWSNKSHIDKLENQLSNIPSYDSLTNFIFHDEFKSLSNRLEMAINSCKVISAAECVALPVSSVLDKILDYLPPIMVTIFKSCIPPIAKKAIIALILRKRNS